MKQTQHRSVCYLFQYIIYCYFIKMGPKSKWELVQYKISPLQFATTLRCIKWKDHVFLNIWSLLANIKSKYLDIHKKNSLSMLMDHSWNLCMPSPWHSTPLELAKQRKYMQWIASITQVKYAQTISNFTCLWK